MIASDSIILSTLGEIQRSLSPNSEPLFAEGRPTEHLCPFPALHHTHYVPSRDLTVSPLSAAGCLSAACAQWAQGLAPLRGGGEEANINFPLHRFSQLFQGAGPGLCVSVLSGRRVVLGIGRRIWEQHKILWVWRSGSFAFFNSTWDL